MSTALGSEGVESLFGSGLFSEALARGGLSQDVVTPPVAELPRQVAALVRNPDVARHLVPTLGRIVAARAVYRARPSGRSDRRLATWSTAATRLLDEPAPGRVIALRRAT